MEEFVTINGLHSCNDLHLVLKKKTIQQPEVKEKTINIPGSDKVINLTKVVSGRTNYGIRKIKIEFQLIDFSNTFDHRYSQMADLFHGEECKVIFSNDPGFFYLGAGKITKGEKKSRIGEITLEVDAEPYKYDTFATDEKAEWDSFSFENGIMQELTGISINEEGKEVVVIARKRASIAQIYVDTATSVMFKGMEYLLEPGWNRFTGALEQGENSLIFYGVGNVTIKYRGGCL